MDENLAPLRAPRVVPVNRSFGNVRLSEVRQRELGLSLVPIEMLHVALEPHSGDITSSSWEVLGEAFLKFFWGTYFFAQHQGESEGTLTTRIQNETQRAALMEYLVSSGIASNVCTKPDRRSYGINGGTEIIRRVIGAAVVHGGVNTAMEVTRTLGAGVDTALTSMNSIRVVDLNTPITTRNAQIPRMIDAETAIITQKVQEALAYQFKDIQLLLEAITHNDAILRSP
ncbi:hypothetical protein BGX21_008929 [Mortierella sp. AD011]|nr:hypothetical protein BGX21_008929 [Mortierella sp. AD011]